MYFGDLAMKIQSKVIKSKKVQVLLEVISIIAFSCLWIFTVFKLIFFPYMITSSGMSPTINAENVIVVSRVKNIQEINRGDIVAFRLLEDCDINIKRVIGVSGDKISLKNGRVIINNVELKENYVQDFGYESGEFIVPDGKFFVLGDNRNSSWDSSKWLDPYLDYTKIEGRVSLKAYPFDEFCNYGLIN